MERRWTPRYAAVLGAATLLLAPLPALAQPAPGAGPDTLVAPTLVADVQSIVPGSAFHLGVRFRIAEGWHINWTNPGDAGLAPSIAWRLGDGFVAQDIEWPYPHRYRAGPLVIFGYNDTVTLWTTVTPSADLAPGGRVTLSAGVDWLACEEACVPGAADVSLTLPVESTARPNPEGRRAYEAFEHDLPVPAGAWRIEARYDDDSIVLEIDPADPSMVLPPGTVYFFPHEPGIIENGEKQDFERNGPGYRLTVPRSRLVRSTPPRLTGVIVADNGWGGDKGPAMQVDVPLEPR